ncbi:MULTISPECIES: outer membrane protein transport protein [unclassified Pseudomonas]|uniref:OmpP1/FadL family transporter n=1 Tax=unclassified Pseudomonas TaxID=196821 RepID=UPI00244A10A6|nr:MULTISPECIES: outer membrane protein transport protein [unclassified Pseudomonas]MDG9924439.1 outer membrane protein transport protein [Pseudomonas sp. GD04045]MDH0035221.1 outer membrane protein transport protein [Pseudomonas sp. GD04019]
MSQPLLAAAAAILLLVPGHLLAGGLMLYEVGTDNVGLANAGAAARAQGPSTLASNVAGIAWLPGTQVSVGAQVLHGHLEFETDGASNVAGADGGNAMEWAPGGSLFISRELGEGWSVGFASYGDFGLSLNYENDWSGRYFLQNGEILGMSLMPALAYRANEQWAFGLGVRAFYAALDSQLAIDNDPFGLLERPDGQLRYSDHDWGYGANLGVIHEPRPGTRLGLSYTSAIDIELEDGLDLQGVGPVVSALLTERGLLGADTRLDMRVPQTLTLSLYQQLDPRWALLASVNWQDWSRFGEVGIELDSNRPRSATLQANYRDTWHLSLGSQFRFAPRWLWSAGVAYDSSPVDDDDRSLAVPMAQSWRFGTGLTHALDEHIDLNLSYELVWLGDMPVRQQKPLPAGDPKRVSGEFEDAWIQALSGSLTWRF